MAVTSSVVVGSVVNPTMTLNGLAASSTRLVGRRSAVVDILNSATWSGGIIPIDVMIDFFFKAGTTPTVGLAELWLAGSGDGTNFAGGVGTTDAAQTLVAETKALLRWVTSIVNNTTTGTVYNMSTVSMAQLFGGVLPQKAVFWFTHSMVAALDASAGGTISLRPVNYTSA